MNNVIDSEHVKQEKELKTSVLYMQDSSVLPEEANFCNLRFLASANSVNLLAGSA
jgi:hypothetical protein